jgi:thiol-disulfide isomerase/thioredoxin
MKNIKILAIKYLMIFFLLLPVLLFGKGNSLNIKPDKPKAGEEIIIAYNPSGNLLEKTDSVKILLTTYSKKRTGIINVDSTIFLDMKKEGNTWIAKVKTSPMTDMGVIEFTSGNLKDINDGSGYFLRLYDASGNETTKSTMGCAILINFSKNIAPTEAKDKEKAEKYLNNLYKSHPELKIEYLIEYIMFQTVLVRENGQKSFMNELSGFEKRNDLSEDEYNTIIDTYLKLKKTDKANEITEKAIKVYPKGKIAVNKILASIKIENDVNKQFEMTKENIKHFAGTEYSSYLAEQVLRIIYEKGSPELLKDYTVYMMNAGLVLFQKGYSYLGALLLKKSNLDLALTIANTEAEEWRKEFVNPTLKKPPAMLENIFKSKNRNMYLKTLIKRASVLALLNRKEEALKDFNIVLSDIPIGHITQETIELYLNCLPDEKKYEIAVPVIEGYYKSGNIMESLKTLLKDIYIKKTGSEEEYEKYIKRIESDIKIAKDEKMKKEIANKKPAPEFTLADFNGKKVSLSDYKGKIVVLDFWATWCGWCKKSFPQMKQAVEKYADKDVIFLFVDTMEKEDNAKEKAKEFITQNNYPFYVIIDTDSKVSKSYGVQGIPAKVFIDKEGNQRYFSKGYSDHIVEEIDEIIELLR